MSLKEIETETEISSKGAYEQGGPVLFCLLPQID
jgi:hypothetical protein